MRNRTIRSVLARRPMFANGGMLPPVTQTPMAAGILSSSAPLIETVNTQQSPNGNVGMSMANGGVARFRHGGFHKYPSRPMSPKWSHPDLPFIRSDTISLKDALSRTLESVVPGLETIGLSPEQIRALAVRYGLISGREPFLEDFQAPAEAPVPDDKFGGIGRIFDLGEPRKTAIRPRVSEIVEETKAPPSAWEVAASEVPITQQLQTQRSYNQPGRHDMKPEFFTEEDLRADMLAPVPEEGDPDAVSALDIYMQTGVNPADMTMDEVKKFHASLPDAPEGMVGSKDLLGRQIRIDEQKIADAQAQDAETVTETVQASEYDPPPDDPGFSTGPLSSLPGVIEGDIEEARKLAEEEAAQAPEVQVKKKPDEVITTTETEKVTTEDGTGPAGGADAGTVVAHVEAAAGEQKADIVAGDQLPPAAAVVEETFAKQNPPGAPAKTKDQYIQEFKEALPKYEGMSEEEKGFTIMEAGLKVMAGQSPNAIKNIAEGLKGISKEFIADKKARRAYDQQTGLSAAKYALERTNADRTRMLDFERKEKDLVYVMNPETGDQKTITKADLRSGNVPKGYLATKDPYKNYIDGVKATKALIDAQAKLIGKGEITSKWVSVGKEYTQNAQKVLDSVQSKNLLGPAIESLWDPNISITGAQGVMATSWNRLKNAFNMKDDQFSKKGEAREKYISRVSQVIAKKITAILGESNRTISTPDRTRADDIAGVFADYLWDPTFKDPDVLKQKIKQLWTTLDNDERLGAAEMNRIVETVGTLTVPGGAKTYADVLRGTGRHILGTKKGIGSKGKVRKLTEFGSFNKKGIFG